MPFPHQRLTMFIPWRTILEGDRLCRLTPKQMETLTLLEQGFTSKQIAKKLEVSASAIDQRIICILRNNGLHDRRELVRRWLQSSDRLPRVAPQVEASLGESPVSNTDQTLSDMDVMLSLRSGDADHSASDELPISKAVRQRASLMGTDLRSVLEATFFAMMNILGACVMVKQVLV